MSVVSGLHGLLKNSSKKQYISKQQTDKILQLQKQEVQLLGENKRQELMFHYIRIEDMVPENHLLRLVDKYIDFGFIRCVGVMCGVKPTKYILDHL